MNSSIANPLASAGKRRVGYRDIFDHLVQEIQRGRWEAGEPIVSEADLVDQFGTTRTTVRQALKELETLGYIKRRRGTRSVLISTAPAEDFVSSVRSIGEMLQYSQHTNSKLLGTEPVRADQRLAERIGARAGSEWLRVEYLRNPARGGLPIGYSEIFVAGAYAGIADELSDNCTIYSLLERQHGALICRVEQDIQAAAADKRAAELLRVAPGSPILMVETRFINGMGVPVEVGFGHFPAGRFRLEMVLERAAGEKLG